MHGFSNHLNNSSCAGSEVCSYPTAIVKLTRRQQLLMVGQTYKIVIHLEMPESPANRELGVYVLREINIPISSLFLNEGFNFGFRNVYGLCKAEKL